MKKFLPTAYKQSKGNGRTRPFRNPAYFAEQIINKMLDRIEYAWHTANFKTKKNLKKQEEN